jgi:hypothetical protein
MPAPNSVPADRPITPKEAAVVRWLLENAPMHDGAEFLQTDIERLHVVETCNCGCYSLIFAEEMRGHYMIGDAMAVWPDGHQQNLMLWGCEGKVVWLEVWDQLPPDAYREPEVSALRTWEDHGRLTL